MSCFGGRGGEEKGALSDQQKWDYINLGDFRSSNCITGMSYVWLWVLVLVAIAVYAADTFTAVRLLGFNEWSSQVKPSIPFAVSKWIFAVCIILSWTILIFEWIRALRVMARNSVADDYLDPLAVKLQSMRWGTGWRRFLVFAELTKSKKKVTWIAIYVYFQRKGAIRLLAADGPRQVVNALTLYSVAKAKLVSDSTTDGRSAVGQFFDNLEILANANKTQTIILSTMAFTLVIWVISMLMLMLALVLYLFFLWHHIHNETLNGFCRRKVERRLERIVKAKTEQIWAKQQAKRAKEEAKMAKSGKSDYSSDDKLPEFGQPQRQPTLPSLGDSPPKVGELMRTESVATLPPYTSKPGTPLDANPPPLPRQPTLPDVGRPAQPMRSFTSSTTISNASYGSSTNLLASAEPMGYSDARPVSPAASYPGKPAPYNSRPGTANSNRSPYGPPLVTPSNDPRFPPPIRTNTGFSTTSRNSPLSASSQDYLLSPEQSRPGTTVPNGGQRRSPLIPLSPYGERTQPPPNGGSYEMRPLSNDSGSATDDVMGDYFPVQPPPQSTRTPGPGPNTFGARPDMLRRDVSAPVVGRTQTPARNFAYPPQPQRSATAPVPDFVRPGPQRSQTAGPQGGQGWR